MQVLIVLNFFLLIVLVSRRLQKIEFSEILSFSLLLFPLRVTVIICSGLLFKSSTFLGLDFNSGNLLTLNSLFFVLLFFASYKILMKSLIRNSELVSRFVLDALPGEQLSVDIAKRDGIYSAKDALAMRTKN